MTRSADLHLSRAVWMSQFERVQYRYRGEQGFLSGGAEASGVQLASVQRNQLGPLHVRGAQPSLSYDPRQFGKYLSTLTTPRFMQFALRFEF